MVCASSEQIHRADAAFEIFCRCERRAPRQASLSGKLEAVNLDYPPNVGFARDMQTPISLRHPYANSSARKSQHAISGVQRDRIITRIRVQTR